MKLIEKQDKSQGVSILVAPYILERTAQICEDNGIGYFDYAGNCLFTVHGMGTDGKIGDMKIAKVANGKGK